VRLSGYLLGPRQFVGHAAALAENSLRHVFSDHAIEQRHAWLRSSACSAAERRVLACTLAHARALATAASEGWDVIVEDNVRLRKDTAQELARLLPTAPAAAEAEATVPSRPALGEHGGEEAVSLRYLGYLGKLESLRSVHGQPASATGWSAWCEADALAFACPTGH
jgi:hypothetical protein